MSSFWEAVVLRANRMTAAFGGLIVPPLFLTGTLVSGLSQLVLVTLSVAVGVTLIAGVQNYVSDHWSRSGSGPCGGPELLVRLIIGLHTAFLSAAVSWIVTKW